VGFTLIELVVSMVIAGIVFSAVMGAYVSLIQTNTRIDTLRQLQKEANFAMTRMTDKIRAFSVDYDAHSPSGSCTFALSSAETRILCVQSGLKFEFKDKNLFMNEDPLFSERFSLKEGFFRVTPEKDPSDLGNPQFQTKVMIFFELEYVSEKDPSLNFSLPLQTTVSSRVYQ
jgi:prepilin-type N-terminal cleavage/methylation domain-containing protein